jgi:hypothetical protein
MTLAGPLVGNSTVSRFSCENLYRAMDSLVLLFPLKKRHFPKIVGTSLAVILPILSLSQLSLRCSCPI